MSKSRKKGKPPKRVLALPDLEQAKSAVLNTLTSRSGQRTYEHAITEFVEWYCSEPRLAFNRTVVLRCRINLEQKKYAPSTINPRLAAVRRIAYEAANSGLLSPELAAGIRRVKGVRRLGIRVGNWITAGQGKRLLERTSADSLRSKRNRAMLSMLIGCGLRRAELIGLNVKSIQLREEHWVIADTAAVSRNFGLRSMTSSESNPTKHSELDRRGGIRSPLDDFSLLMISRNAGRYGGRQRRERTHDRLAARLPCCLRAIDSVSAGRYIASNRPSKKECICHARINCRPAV